MLGYAVAIKLNERVISRCDYTLGQGKALVNGHILTEPVRLALLAQKSPGRDRGLLRVALAAAPTTLTQEAEMRDADRSLPEGFSLWTLPYEQVGLPLGEHWFPAGPEVLEPIPLDADLTIALPAFRELVPSLLRPDPPRRPFRRGETGSRVGSGNFRRGRVLAGHFSWRVEVGGSVRVAAASASRRGRDPRRGGLRPSTEPAPKCVARTRARYDTSVSAPTLGPAPRLRQLAGGSRGSRTPRFVPAMALPCAAASVSYWKARTRSIPALRKHHASPPRPPWCPPQPRSRASAATQCRRMRSSMPGRSDRYLRRMRAISFASRIQHDTTHPD